MSRNNRPPRQIFSRLNVEELEDRTTPATFAVKLLSAPAGVPGNTAATISGSISYLPDLPTDGGGAVLVEATSALDAVR